VLFNGFHRISKDDSKAEDKHSMELRLALVGIVLDPDAVARIPHTDWWTRG